VNSPRGQLNEISRVRGAAHQGYLLRMNRGLRSDGASNLSCAGPGSNANSSDPSPAY